MTMKPIYRKSWQCIGFISSLVLEISEFPVRVQNNESKC